MLATLTAVTPVFALIFVGWLARRLGALGPAATGELSRYTVYLALPALLFDIVAHAAWAEIWQPGFVAAFGLGALLISGLALFARLQASHSLADAAIDGLNAGYANVGFIGFPLTLAAFGRQALAPTLIASLITACVLFALGIVLIETGLQTETGRRRVAVKVGVALVRNPLLIAPALGAVFPLAGVGLPVAAESFVKLLGASASPCALVALGLFLAEQSETTGATKAAGWLIGLKLIAQPALTWALATQVFGLTPLLTHTAVLLAALPTGTGPFMLAEIYGREAATTSLVVLVSTVASVATVSAYLALAV
jgi:malonate transporter and related proteins